MSFALIRKDYQIILRENFSVFLIQMLGILVITSANIPGALGYGLLTVGGAWHLLMSVGGAERASSSLAYLISTPYSRIRIILSRYGSTFLLFVMLTLCYALLAFVTRALGLNLFPLLTPSAVVITFAAYSLFVSITLPLYFFLTDMTIRLISLGLILGTAFLSYGLMKYSGFSTILSAVALYRNHLFLISALLSVLSATVSVSVSKFLFDRSEF